MRSISRLKVSTKLAGASIIIVAFVVAIIGSQLWGSSAVQTSTTNLARRAALARTLLEANAGVKGMQIGMLRLRTAYNAKDIADAQAVLVSSAAATTKAIDHILNTSSLESTRKAMTSFKQKIAEFNAYANTVAGLQTQMFELQAQEAKAGHDVAALAALKQKANALEAQEQQIGRGKVAPIAAEISTTATKLATRIAGHMDQDAVNAENTLHLVKYVGLAISLTSILILIGAALLGHRAIALPLRALVRSLRQMAQGEEVEITGIKRGDEIGDAARAVNDIKALLAEKARREAEEKAAADKARTQREAEQAARTAEERAEQEKRTAAERDAATQKAADEFQAAIGGIVNAAVAGDFSQRVDLQGKTGLVLNVGTAINSLCENVAMALDDLVGMLNGLAEGDLTKRITAHYEGSFALLKDNANMTAERIGSTIADIKATAREVTDASKEITTSTTDLSQRTEEQAASLEETSASMEEMAATVKKNAENAQAANQSAIATRKVADRGGEVVAQAVTAMAQIEESSRNISEIIVVIDEIARQTNLLALNAAVEAARAGDAGRGFAVVATEVRSLAQRSSQAAKDIKDLIVNSGGQVKEGVELVNRAGTALTEITESIKQVADLVSDIATASAEQSTGIDEVNRALTQMDEATQQNSALVEENAATAKTLESQAKAMDDRIAFFRVADSGQFGAWGQGRAAGRADMRSLPAAKAPSLASEPVPAARAQAKGASRSPVRRVQNAVAAAWKDF